MIFSLYLMFLAYKYDFVIAKLQLINKPYLPYLEKKTTLTWSKMEILTLKGEIDFWFCQRIKRTLTGSKMDTPHPTTQHIKWTAPLRILWFPHAVGSGSWGITWPTLAITPPVPVADSRGCIGLMH